MSGSARPALWVKSGHTDRPYAAWRYPPVLPIMWLGSGIAASRRTLRRGILWLVGARRHRETAGGAVTHLDLRFPGQSVTPGNQILHIRVGAVTRPALHRHIATVAELIDVVLHTPVARASRTRSGRNSQVIISSGRLLPSTIGVPSKLTNIPSPIESKVPSEPHIHTLAVYIRLQKALAWLVTSRYGGWVRYNPPCAA